MAMVKIGIIGLGWMGSLHYKLLRESLGIDVVAVCDIDESRLEEPKKNRVRVYRDYREMLEEGGFDGVIIATPPKFHKEQAIEALKRGFYVLLEKPMAKDLKEAMEIYNIAKGKNRLMIAFSLRFHELYTKIKEYIDQELGDIVYQWHIALGRIPSYPWIGDREFSGGMLNENGVHVLYYQMWYAGEVDEVYATSRTLQQGISIEDNIALYMKHRNGATSVFIQSWSGGHRWRKWGLVALRGRVTVEGYLGGSYTVSRMDGSIVEEKNFDKPIEDMYIAQLKHFIECIENSWRPIVNEEDGIKIQQIVEAAYLSSRESKPIKLPLSL